MIKKYSMEYLKECFDVRTIKTFNAKSLEIMKKIMRKNEKIVFITQDKVIIDIIIAGCSVVRRTDGMDYILFSSKRTWWGRFNKTFRSKRDVERFQEEDGFVCGICYEESDDGKTFYCSNCRNGLCEECYYKLIYTRCPFCRYRTTLLISK